MKIGKAKFPTHARLSWRWLLALLLTLFFWSSAFAVIRVAAHEYSPGGLACLRFLTASGVLLLCAPFAGVRVPPLRDWPGLAAMGFCGIAVYHVALNAGEHTVTAGSAAFLVNVSPIFVAILAALFLHEKPSWRAALGIAVSFAGATLIALGEGSGQHGASRGGVLSPGALLILLAALSASVYMVLQKSFLRKYRPFEVACYGVWAGTAILLVFAPGLGEQIRQASPTMTIGVLYLGVFPGALAYAVWAFVLSRVRAATAASYLYLVPALSLLLAWIFLREVPQPAALLGGLIALAGVLLVSLERPPAPLEPLEA